MPDIYHITRRDDWENARDSGSYAPASLQHEGFIHCSRQSQVLGVANSWYRGQADLVLLRIDAARVVPEIRYEDCYDTGRAYPHIYGPLDVNAVTAVIDFPPDGNGRFVLPSGVA